MLHIIIIHTQFLIEKRLSSTLICNMLISWNFIFLELKLKYCCDVILTSTDFENSFYDFSSVHFFLDLVLFITNWLQKITTNELKKLRNEFLIHFVHFTQFLMTHYHHIEQNEHKLGIERACLRWSLDREIASVGANTF